MICPKGKTPSTILLPLYLLDDQSKCTGWFDSDTFPDDFIGPEMAQWMESHIKEHGVNEMVRFLQCLDCTHLLPKYRFYAFTCLARRGQYYPSPPPETQTYKTRSVDIRVYRLNNWRRLSLMAWRKTHNLLISQLNEIFHVDVYAFLYGGAVIKDAKWKKIQTAMRSYEVNHNGID